MLRPAYLAVATLTLAVADPNPVAREPALAGARLYYGPSTETASVDLDALSHARKTIDMAAYVLTDRDLMGALGGAARRGVKIRIYLDRSESTRSSAKTSGALAGLAATTGVTIRFNPRGRDAMHLKAYLIDQRVLRTGSANFSYSGERFQDNDVVLLESSALAGAFAQNFETMWAREDNEEFSR